MTDAEAAAAWRDLAAKLRKEKTELQAEVRRLRADLVHARHWATYTCDECLARDEFGYGQTPGESAAFDAAVAYCYAGPERGFLVCGPNQNLKASDGWQVGQPVEVGG